MRLLLGLSTDEVVGSGLKGSSTPESDIRVGRIILDWGRGSELREGPLRESKFGLIL